MPRTVLLCTVGGSPEPIVKAIESKRPDHVAFLCSEDIVWEDGQRTAGSRHEIAKPGGIAERADLAADRYEIATVPHPDDPDGGFLVARELLARLRGRFPDAEIVADYTGGTKSMTAALMLAATAAGDPRLRIQFVSGVRKDLVRVLSGTERPLDIAVDAISAERDLDRVARAWRSFAYQEAEALLEPYVSAAEGTTRLPAALRQRITTLHQLSAGFAAWDRFEHGDALRLLCELREVVPRHVTALRRLPQAGPPRPELFLLVDLWHNAHRRAARGRFDDAIARCYRLVEATAQWLLVTRHGLPPSRLPVSALPTKRRKEWADGLPDDRTIDLPLEKTWRLLKDRELSLVGRSAEPMVIELFASSSGTSRFEAMRHWLSRRNHSILAHGFRPIDRDLWDEVRAWLAAAWLPWLERQAEAIGLDLPQLPTELPAV